MRGLVLVGVPVPVRAVGAPRLRLVDGPALDPHRPVVRQAHGHEGTAGPALRRACATMAPVDFSSLTPLAGGWSGQTFLAEAAGSAAWSASTRPAARGPQAAEIDAAVLRLVRGLVPVPEVLEVRPARCPTRTSPGCW